MIGKAQMIVAIMAALTAACASTGLGPSATTKEGFFSSGGTRVSSGRASVTGNDSHY